VTTLVSNMLLSMTALVSNMLLSMTALVSNVLLSMTALVSNMLLSMTALVSNMLLSMTTLVSNMFCTGDRRSRGGFLKCHAVTPVPRLRDAPPQGRRQARRAGTQHRLTACAGPGIQGRQRSRPGCQAVSEAGPGLSAPVEGARLVLAVAMAARRRRSGGAAAAQRARYRHARWRRGGV
jgi:hypothetical protein